MDWADRLAAECIKTVFGKPDARDVIAALLRDVKFDGVKVGVTQAHQMITDQIAGKPAPTAEVVDRIRNACQQI